MTSNKLFINPNKTEYLLFLPNNVNFSVNVINLSSNNIPPKDFPKNLDVTFQTDMSIDKHISSIVKFCFFQLCGFHQICLFISKTAAITLVKVFTNSRLGFCNSLYYDPPKYSIHRLQKV